MGPTSQQRSGIYRTFVALLDQLLESFFSLVRILSLGFSLNLGFLFLYCLPSLPAETDLNVAGNAANISTNPSLNQPGSSPSPSSSPPLSVGALGPQVIPRRHAPADVIARQGSFRGFPALSQKTSPFKRQLSLRPNELPSTMQRKSDFPIKNAGDDLWNLPKTLQKFQYFKEGTVAFIKM